jgi:hydroxycarboxylate dehydrogenase B
MPMPADTKSTAVLSFDAAEVERFMARIFVVGGWSPDDAAVTAENLVAADRAGHASHGIGLVPSYVETWRNGKLSPDWKPTTIKDDGPFVVIEGHRSLGQPSARNATLKAIDVAKRHGMAIVNLINSHHVGRIGHYGDMVARAGFVGLFWVNVHGRKPTVVPFGAREPRFSTNPHCVAIPRADGEPFLLDFATAEMAVNKARVAHAKGQKVRPGVLVDNQGRPTDDPGVLFSTPRGSIATFGQHKGSGLAIACELMSAVLGSGPLVADEDESGAILNNMMCVVIDPARMATGDEPIAAATARMLGYVESAAPAEGTAKVLTPGQPERANRERLGKRLEIEPATWGDIEKAALSIGIAAADIPKPA